VLWLWSRFRCGRSALYEISTDLDFFAFDGQAIWILIVSLVECLSFKRAKLEPKVS
jgi:hypothetical protein